MPAKPSDFFTLNIGDVVTAADMNAVIQGSKQASSSFYEGADWRIGNTPQQGINWIGASPKVKAVIIKLTGGYKDEFLQNGEKLKYHFKANKGVVNKKEQANQVLIQQQKKGYPILVFKREKKDYSYFGRYTVFYQDKEYVLLERMRG